MKKSPAGDDGLGPLCARWRRHTVAEGWRMPEDWSTPAVVPLAYAVLNGLAAEVPAQALGTARALADVGVTEGLRDVGALYDLCLTTMPLSVTLAFAAGWETADTGPDPQAAARGMSGLPQHAEFLARAADVFAGIESTKDGGSLVLVTIDGRVGKIGSAARLVRWKRDVLLGEAVRLSFGEDYPTGYRDGVAVVLGRSEPAGRVLASVARARATLTSLARQNPSILRAPIRITVQPLPEDLAALRSLITADAA
ncbi:hypothetical protein [Promicromonospora panici]|uniref:hypothetical protein n=1 Tax=Promicromonospora panici TaxID=2219658 RepID=UPI00101C5087|nr:hypothetical protein [Promicromonospora panici]